MAEQLYNYKKRKWLLIMKRFLKAGLLILFILSFTIPALAAPQNWERIYPDAPNIYLDTNNVAKPPEGDIIFFVERTDFSAPYYQNRAFELETIAYMPRTSEWRGVNHAYYDINRKLLEQHKYSLQTTPWTKVSPNDAVIKRVMEIANGDSVTIIGNQTPAPTANNQPSSNNSPANTGSNTKQIDTTQSNSNALNYDIRNDSTIEWREVTFEMLSYLKNDSLPTKHILSMKMPKKWEAASDVWPGAIFSHISDKSGHTGISLNSHQDYWQEEPSRCHDITKISTFTTDSGMKADMYEAVRNQNQPMNGVQAKVMAMSFSSPENPSFKCYFYFYAPVAEYDWYKKNVFILMAKLIKVDFTPTVD